MSYQEKTFLSLLENFKKHYLKLTQEKENTYNNWKKQFIKNYPRDSILSMRIDDYLISTENNKSGSFCRQICSILKNNFGKNIGNNRWATTFGVAVKCGKELVLSVDLTDKFGVDYNSAFKYIKNEIINLLNEVDKGNYCAVERCELSYKFKYILLIIYCSDKMLPICRIGLTYRYCESIGIKFEYHREIIYGSNLLIQFKNEIYEFSNWSNFIFTSFCDWLYRKNYIIPGDFLIKERRLKDIEIISEINSVNLTGKENEAYVKVRINQDIFRNRLLKRSEQCCLCKVKNRSLLIASHIKPWAVSAPEEKLDIYNGFLMCPNHDKLFDIGFITFNDNGEIIISNELSEADRNALNIREDMSILIVDNNKKYLKYHREHVFKKK